MKIKNLMLYVLTGSMQSYREVVLETEKMLSTIKINNDSYDVDNRIKFLKDKDIKIKYKVI